jgi:hypothetical protein
VIHLQGIDSYATSCGFTDHTAAIVTPPKMVIPLLKPGVKKLHPAPGLNVSCSDLISFRIVAYRAGQGEIV